MGGGSPPYLDRKATRGTLLRVTHTIETHIIEFYCNSTQSIFYPTLKERKFQNIETQIQAALAAIEDQDNSSIAAVALEFSVPEQQL